MTSPLSQAEFLAARRTRLLGYPMYSQMIGDIVENYDEITSEYLQSRLSAPDCTIGRISDSAQAKAWDSVTYLHLQYSAGVSPEHLRAFFLDALTYHEEYASYHVQFHRSPEASPHKVPHWDLFDRDFWKAIRFASFAILLGHTDLLSRIAAVWDYENDELDGLLERLVAPFVPGRASPPDACTRHLPYFKLLKVFAADASKRPALMTKYMDEWYTASRREPYYESHTKGREHSFLGYWSFEAAAVAYVLDIDDASFRDHEFYPKDLADFARSLPRPTALGGTSCVDAISPERLHCPGGLPCPRAGFWFSPARPDSRRRFDAGETMPDLGGDYGTTIWQWDERQ